AAAEPSIAVSRKLALANITSNLHLNTTAASLLPRRSIVLSLSRSVKRSTARLAVSRRPAPPGGPLTAQGHPRAIYSGRLGSGSAAGSGPGLCVKNSDFEALNRRRLRALHLVGHPASMLVRRFLASAHRLLIVPERYGDCFTCLPVDEQDA